LIHALDPPKHRVIVHREQAHSHRETLSTCGSELAREDVCAGDTFLPAIVVSRSQKGTDHSRFGKHGTITYL